MKLEPGTIYIVNNNDKKFVILDAEYSRDLSPGRDRFIRSRAVRDEDRTVLGRLPPDQLDATEWRDEYRLPGSWEEAGVFWSYADRGWKLSWPKDKTPLEPGLVVAFRSWPERKWGGLSKIELGTPLLIVDYSPVNEHGHCARKLADNGSKVLSPSRERRILETDDLEVLGRIPLDQLYTATEIPPQVELPIPNHESRFSEKEKAILYNKYGSVSGEDVARNVEKLIQSSDPGKTCATSLPPGTRFRFRSWPERWLSIAKRDSILLDRIFQVCEDSAYTVPDGQCFCTVDQGDLETGCFRTEAGVLSTDDIEILSMPAKAIAEGLEPEAPAPFTWRGWGVQQHPAGGWWARKDGQTHMTEKDESLDVLLDRIAEAEGLRNWTDQSHRLDDQCALKQQLATERTTREKAEKERDTVCAARNTFMKAFKDAVGVDYRAGVQWENGAANWKKAHDKVAQAFRAATGQEYQAGKDCSVLKSLDEFEVGDVVQEVSVRSPFVIMGNKMGRHVNSQKLHGPWISTEKKYEFLYKLEEKGDPVMFKTVAKSGVKWLTIIAIITSLSHLISPQSVIEWWRSPPTLELGNWVKVTSCDDCGHVGTDQMCPSCGGEEFSERKAQELIHDPIGSSPRAVGHTFENGNSYAPGDWILPERRSTRM